MALISYKIDRDGSGTVTITSTIQRIDPGDEIVLTTDTPNTSLQFLADSPFAAPAAEKIYLLPLANESPSPQPLQVTRSTDLTQAVAQCGETDENGNLKPWAQGAGFPNGSGTNIARGA